MGGPKTCSIQPSRVVPHRSTTWTRGSLTSLFGWEAVTLPGVAACEEMEDINYILTYVRKPTRSACRGAKLGYGSIAIEQGLSITSCAPSREPADRPPCLQRTRRPPLLVMLSFLLPTCALLLAPSQPAGAPRCVPPLAKLAPVPSATAIAGIQPTLDELSSQLAAVRALRPSDQSPAVQASLWRAAGLNPTFKVSGVVTGEPSFTRLFDHATWSRYTGISPFRRWCRAVRTWRFSTVLAALWPIILVAAAWAFLVASLPSAWLPRTAPGPHGLMGSAIGLLLVFRTNNTYQRLNEARLLWGRAVYLCREIAQNAATALLFDEAVLPRR